MVPRTRASLAALLLLTACAMPAAAQGISLRWTNCASDGGERNRNFACNTNAGQEVLVTSFVLAEMLGRVETVRATIDVIAEDVTLPAWWNLRACRGGSELMNPSAVDPVACVDPWPSDCADPGGIELVYPGFLRPNVERIRMIRKNCGVTPNLSAGPEYLGPPLTLSHILTVGSPSCGGCSARVCIVLHAIQIEHANGTLLLSPPVGSSDDNFFVTWQDATLLPGGGCLATTPTHRTVWGAVKALYR